jgi:anthranilate/para-aminobenzoate synthase component I
MLASGAVRPLARLVQRRLNASADPFDLYAALDLGPNTGLFEGVRGPSLLIQHAAVRRECRGKQVCLHALSVNGASLIGSIRTALPGYIAESGDATLTLRLPLSRSLDAEQRLLAPSPLQAIRSLLRSAMPEGEEPFAAARFGVIGFDYAGLAEDLPDNREDPLSFPDYLFWIPDSLILFEPGMTPRILCSAFHDPDPDQAIRNHHDAFARLESMVEACQRERAPAHLVSSVTGRLGIGFDAFDALTSCLNVGTLVGAPKIRAMQLLRETERTRRGPYGGAIGWINGDGLMDTSVVIRTAVIRDGIAHVRAGAGVVHDSDPQAEADETRRKASALLSVLASVSAGGAP